MSKTISVLTCPGMGDIHWIVLKLQALAKQEGADKIALTIWDADKKVVHGKQRSLAYVERLPFLDHVGVFNEDWTYQKDKWSAAVHEDGADLQMGFDDFDYVMSFNGSLRHGRDIRYEILPELDCNFDYPVTERITDALWGDQFYKQIGPFIMFYFNDLLMYKQNWLKHFSLNAILDLIDRLRAVCPLNRMVLTGVTWDEPFNKQIADKLGSPDWLVNMTTKTDAGHLFAMIRRASAFIGWCAGNTIMSTHFGTPTVMLWSDYFQSRKFATCWADPLKIGNTYRPLFVEDITPEDVVTHTLAARAKDARGNL